jgi:hypothetical protein
MAEEDYRKTLLRIINNLGQGASLTLVEQVWLANQLVKRDDQLERVVRQLSLVVRHSPVDTLDTILNEIPWEIK